MFIASAITVSKVSSLTNCSFKPVRSICLTDLIILSQTPPLWLADGGLNVQWIFLCKQNVLTCSSFHRSIHSFNSLLALTKLEPRSLLICSGHPRILINRRRAFNMESVSKECDISICTARVVKQVKIHPYLFTVHLLCLTRNGPK